MYFIVLVLSKICLWTFFIHVIPIYVAIKYAQLYTVVYIYTVCIFAVRIAALCLEKKLCPCRNNVLHGLRKLEPCTMLLEQIKGFYCITKIFLLVGSYTMLSCIFKDVYIIVHVRIDCGI